MQRERRLPSLLISDDMKDLMEKSIADVPARPFLQKIIKRKLYEIDNFPNLLEVILNFGGRRIDSYEIFLDLETAIRYEDLPQELEAKFSEGFGDILFRDPTIKLWVKEYLPKRLEEYRHPQIYS